MSKVDKSILNVALSHTRKEIGLANMRSSLKSGYETIQKTHDSIHEFIYLTPLCLPSQPGVTWHSKSAFLTYQWEAFTKRIARSWKRCQAITTQRTSS